MFVLKFSTDNEAFADNAEEEIGRILERIAGLARNGHTGGPVFDYNGNGVGTWSRT